MQCSRSPVMVFPRPFSIHNTPQRNHIFIPSHRFEVLGMSKNSCPLPYKIEQDDGGHSGKMAMKNKTRVRRSWEYDRMYSKNEETKENRRDVGVA